MTESGAAQLPPRGAWWGFVVYGVVCGIHITALLLNADAVAGPSKLFLMPVLALAVIWAARDLRWTAPLTLLIVALAFSLLGDGAATFFPFLPDELPAMLLCFGIAHIAYIVLFWRSLAVRRVPLWALVYAIWWVVLLAVLWPHLGGLAFAVAGYGIVLGGTAVLSTRCHPAIAWGGAFFLVSDTVLAFQLFLPGQLPAGSSALVMVTYTLGQGLIAAGAVLAVRALAQTDAAPGRASASAPGAPA